MTHQIIDHAERLIRLLPQQFKEGKNWQGLLKAVAIEVQQLENELYKFFGELSIDNAIGQQLDGLGEILGESRNGRNDSDYRAALTIRSKINTSSGEPETLISVLAAITNSTVVQLSEPDTAFIQLTFNGSTVPNGLLDSMRLIKAAGVELSILINTSSNPFVFEGDSTGNGFSSLSSPSDGGELSGVII